MRLETSSLVLLLLLGACQSPPGLSPATRLSTPRDATAVAASPGPSSPGPKPLGTQTDLGPKPTGPQTGLGPRPTGPRAEVLVILELFRTLGEAPGQSSRLKTRVAAQDPLPLPFRLEVLLRSGQRRELFAARLGPDGSYVYAAADLSEIRHRIEALNPAEVERLEFVFVSPTSDRSLYLEPKLRRFADGSYELELEIPEDLEAEFPLDALEDVLENESPGPGRDGDEDGRDNDGDGRIDEEDEDITAVPDGDEDGRDNDADGLIDEADEDV